MIENPIPWPDSARCAVSFTFDMDAESLVHMYLTETAHNRIALSSMLALWARGGGPPDRRRLQAFQTQADLLHPGLVHRAVSTGHRANPRRRGTRSLITAISTRSPIT